MVATAAEVAAMRRAVELAARGRGRPHPNPLVGAVVLDAAGAVVGEGWHARDVLGAPHAEVVALAQAGDRARGATVVTTLEPCTHTGRTAPCADAIVQAGVRRVVVAVREPTPRAAGGVDVLRAAGLDVEVDVEQAAAERGNEAWLVATALGRPFVTLKIAATLDGRVAATDGTSQWITGAAARADAHELRSACDAIAVGVGTVLADDPHLTARTAAGELRPRQPLRVVFDTEARTPAAARVRDTASDTCLLVADDVDLADERGVCRLPRADAGVAVDAALKTLYASGVQHLLLEGGPRLAASFVDSGCVDRVVAYLAPALMGSGRPAVDGGFGTATIAGLRRLDLDEVRVVGDDVRIEARTTRSA